jgi:hypothetical protein
VRRVLKTILLAVVGLYIVLAIIVVGVIYFLPSLSKVAQLFLSKPQVTEISVPEMVQDTDTVTASDDPTVVAPAVAEANVNSNLAPPVEDSDSQVIEDPSRALLDPNTPLSEFCDNLKNARSSGGFSPAEFNASLRASFNPSQADPRVQAMKPLLKALFRQPEVAELIALAQVAQQEGEENFWQKANFYAQAARAFQGIMSQRDDFEAIADRSYLLLKLNDLVVKQPQALGHAAVQKFCETTERAFNEAEPVQWDLEKKDFEGLLSEVGVSAQDIGYDPNYKTRFQVQLQGNQLILRGGWLDEVIQDKERP